MMELSAIVVCRKKDKGVAQKAAEAAAQQYQEISGREVKIDVRAELPDDG